MTVDFFKVICQEPLRKDFEFGLCDDNNGQKAYTNIDDPEKWIAKVKNDNKKELVFTAIDKCIINDEEHIGRGRCDGMLTSDEHLFFVELKDKLPPWQTEAKVQLESTVQFFIESHDASVFKHKKIFACNKKAKKFIEIDNEENLKFFRKYKFRIDLQNVLLVI